MNLNSNELEFLNSEEATEEQITIYDVIQVLLDDYYSEGKYSIYFSIIKPNNWRKIRNYIKDFCKLDETQTEKAMRIFKRENERYYKYYKEIYKDKEEIKKLKFKLLQTLLK